MSAGKLTELKKMVTGLVRRNNQFDRDTARALVQSAGLGKAVKSRKSRATNPRKGSRRVGDTRMVTAPAVRAAVISNLGIGMPDMSLPFCYQAGRVLVGNGVEGPADWLFFAPSRNTTTVGSLVRAVGYCPIMPGDSGSMGSVLTGCGWGVDFLTDIFKHFARVRYDQLQLEFLPLGAGSSTTAGVSITVAPFRGNIDGGGYVSSWSSTSPYAVAQGATGTSLPAAQLMANKGAIQFPCWEKAVLDMTPYIAGGSGPRQNEFTVNANNSVSLGTLIASSQIVPAAFAVGGIVNNAQRGNFVSTVLIRGRITLLDFFSGMAILNPVGAADHKELPPPIELKRPPPLDFKSALGRRVDDAPSPTKSLLGAELDRTYVPVDPARARSSAMPIPNVKR